MERQWKNITISDNFMFQQVMKKESICRKFLEKLLKMEIVNLKYINTERTFETLVGSKSVRLDLYIEDSQRRVYDIEMQTSNLPNSGLPKRARYYQGVYDVYLNLKGDKYQDIRETFVIFICSFDLFGEGRSIYTFRNYCQENKDLELGDGSVKIFLNSKGSREGIDPDIAAFLDYVNGQEPKGEFAEEIAQEVDNVKARREVEEEFMTYLSGYDNARAEGEARGRAEGEAIGRAEGEAIGRAEGKVERDNSIASMMLKAKEPVSKIIQYTQLPLEKIKELAASIGVAVVI